ncbi:unnamed protein product [Rotaria sp. Silwood1]|nr:unnamed protein product [Rotaria sp. Silwood1]
MKLLRPVLIDSHSYIVNINRRQVVVSKKSSPDQEVVLKILGEGDYFGALPIFFNIPSHVALKARDQVTCMMMDRQTFQGMVAPEIKLMERISQAYYEFIHSVEK